MITARPITATLLSAPYQSQDKQWRVAGLINGRHVTIKCREEHSGLRCRDSLTVERSGADWRA